ncbi:multicomponent Na+:H+ antiporter subunit D [Mumia flava]|uniref:Multicomponent Na+:H+ antiporter subunit D n=1 Tax=Mumia flava TaxID=1348852 RepID=A0A0B2BNC1_9ACTN|nr:Na+/H+ antiporter subunit D [Mumia flava]PJJ57215.1 multicomponent Na+:H+ antiporter subunit D [Mumia flava]
MTVDSATSYLIPLPVLLPLLAAGLCLVLGHHARAQRVISFAALSTVVVIAGILVVAADRHGPQVVNVGGWPSRMGIVLVADRLSALLLLVSAIVTLCVLAYSVGQGIIEFGRDTPLSVFYPTYLVLVAGVSNAFLSGDLFNLYVGFEVLLAASYVLITLGGTGPRIRSGTTYVVVAVLSSVLFLVAIAATYAATGTVNLADLAVKLQEVPPGVRLVLQTLLLVAFAVKAAVFPLSTWLPDSYPTAPAPVTAVFAGLLTKVGVYAIMRTQTLLFPDSPLSSLLMWAALATMLIGILGAVAQSDIKRMLSFTLISHIGFLVFGVALATEAGLSGAIFYIVHHITIQTTLFLVTGLIEIRGASTSLEHLGGLARAAPFLAILFFLPAMNLAGIPPFSGFLGKVALMQAGVDQAGWLTYVLVAGGLATSLLTLYAIAKTWNRAFWKPRAEVPPEAAMTSGTKSGAPWGQRVPAAALDADRPEEVGTAVRRLPLAMVAPTVALVVAGTAITLVAGPLLAVTDRAAEQLRHREPYVTAVLDDGSGVP